MIRIGITDPTGFFGNHIRWFFLSHKDEVEIVEIPEEYFEGQSSRLARRLQPCDVILHLASAHPGNTPADAIYDANIGLAKKIMDALDNAGTRPYTIFASTTQIRRDNPYGNSKREVGKMLLEWGKSRDAKVTNLIIPNEFGEWGEPFTISVVSTFCHQIARGETSTVHPETRIPLIYAQAVAQRVYGLIKKPETGDVELPGTDIPVADIYAILRRQHDSYASGIVPVLQTPLHIQLFNTLRSHLFANGFYPRAFEPKSDARGTLVEIIKTTSGGQTFISSTVPNAVRGNHYHLRKVERFAVMRGTAKICVRKLLSKEIFAFDVSGDTPVYIDMPTFATHNILNTGTDELVTAFWTNEIYDPADPDTFPEPV